MSERLSGVIFRLATLSSSVTQLEEASRLLENSALNNEGDDAVSRLAGYVINQQSTHRQKLQELSRGLSERLSAIKNRLRDVTVQVQELRHLADGPVFAASPVERIVRFFGKLRTSPGQLPYLPLAIVHKANYTIIDMLSFDTSDEKRVDRLLATEIHEKL